MRSGQQSDLTQRLPGLRKGPDLMQNALGASPRRSAAPTACRFGYRAGIQAAGRSVLTTCLAPVAVWLLWSLAAECRMRGTKFAAAAAATIVFPLCRRSFAGRRQKN